MSDAVGFDIKPQDDTSLFTMLEYGLSKFLEQLDEIGVAASKEYSLEKGLERMKFEWKEMFFEFIPYRDTVSWTFCFLFCRAAYVADEKQEFEIGTSCTIVNH